MLKSPWRPSLSNVLRPETEARGLRDKLSSVWTLLAFWTRGYPPGDVASSPRRPNQSAAKVRVARKQGTCETATETGQGSKRESATRAGSDCVSLAPDAVPEGVRIAQNDAGQHAADQTCAE